MTQILKWVFSMENEIFFLIWQQKRRSKFWFNKKFLLIAIFQKLSKEQKEESNELAYT